MDGLKIGVDDEDYESKQFQLDSNFKNNKYISFSVTDYNLQLIIYELLFI